MDNLSRKLQFFTQAMHQEIDAKREESLHKLAADLDEQISTTLAEVEKKISDRINSAKRSIEKSYHRQIFEATQSAKAAFIMARRLEMDKIYDAVTVKLEAFTQTPEYEAYILKAIADRQHGYKFVQLPSQHMHLAAAISIDDLIAEVCNTEHMGGFILINASRTVYLNHTFTRRLENIKLEGIHNDYT